MKWIALGGFLIGWGGFVAYRVSLRPRLRHAGRDIAGTPYRVLPR
jgi:hypothetical protein